MSPAMFDLACKQLSHVKCVSLPTSEWVRVTLQLCWVLILNSTSLRAPLHLMYTQKAGTRIITIRLLLAVLNISKSAECQSEPFLQKLVMGASLFSQQDGQCVGNKQPLHAFPNCSAPTWKKITTNWECKSGLLPTPSQESPSVPRGEGSSQGFRKGSHRIWFLWLWWLRLEGG